MVVAVVGGERLTALIVFLCLLICAALFAGGFYLAKYVVERQHRVNVLEDAYKEATDHIAQLQNEIAALNQQLEYMQYEAKLAEERANQPRAWNPRDPLNSGARM